MNLRNGASIAVILFGAMSLGLVFGCVIPILPSIALHFGGGSGGALIAQLVFAIACVGMMSGGPIAGWLMARHDPRTILLITLVTFSLAGSAGLILDSAVAFLASRFLLGLSAAAINTAGVTLISQRFEPLARTRVLGYYNACGPIASVLALGLSGIVSEALGWRGPFLFYFVGFGVVALALYSIPASRPAPRTQAIAGGAFWRPLLPYYALLVPLSVPLFTASLQIPFLLAEHGYARPAVIATIAAISSISVSSGALCYGRLRQALGEKGVLIFMLTAIGSGHLILGGTQALALTAVGAIITQFGGGLLLPHFLNLLLDRTPVATHAKVSGWVYSAHFLGIFMNSLVLAPINVWLGIEHALMLLGLILASVAVIVAVRPATRRLEME
jgi:MFS family permease